MLILLLGDFKNFTKSKLYKSLKNIKNINFTSNINLNYDCVLKWCDYVKNKLIYPEIPKNIKSNVKIINKDFISQDRYYLEPFHRKAFGYDLNIDPFTFTGTIFRKATSHDSKFLKLPENLDDDYHNKNGKPYYFIEKNGIRYMTFKGPIDKKDNNSVYQKCINREKGNGIFQDYRLTIINRKPFILLDMVHPDFIAHAVKKKTIIAKKPEDFFSSDYLNKLDVFLNLINLDYGDLDLVIDTEDNNTIYICDINNTPMCGGSTPQVWYKDCWDDYLKSLNNMINSN